MDKIIAIISNFSNKRYEEDFIDRLNFQLTPYLFVTFGALITTYTYMSKAITCWTPNEFAGGWTAYANDYCFIENTYYVPLTDPNMPDHYTRERTEIPYYQWVNFVLILLGFCFYLPHVLWRSLNWWSGIQVRAIVNKCSTIEDGPKRKSEIENVVNHIKNTLFENRQTAVNSRFEKSYVSNVWVTGVYFLMKLIFIFNIIVQLCILHRFLGFSWLDLLSLRLGFQSDWQQTGLFPRSTMCDFEIRNKGNVQRYSVQCVLIQNMFNEKIFLVLFYWLLILFMLTVGNTFVWCIQLLSKNRSEYIRRLLQSAGQQRPNIHDRDESNHYEEFVEATPDATLLYHLISSNAGDSVCCEVIKTLYDKTKIEHL